MRCVRTRTRYLKSETVCKKLEAYQFKEHVLCLSPGGVEQLLQGWLWNGFLLQQHLFLCLPLLSSVRKTHLPSVTSRYYSKRLTVVGRHHGAVCLFNKRLIQTEIQLCGGFFNRGNFKGWEPYKVGPSCASCSNNCEDKLCSKWQIWWQIHTGGSMYGNC